MTTQEYNDCVERHADSLYRFILNNIRDEDEARDLVQDAFEKMWRNVAKVEGTKAKSYLFTTGYHTMIDRIRKKSRITELSEAHEDSLQDNQQYTDLKQILHQAVNKLPEIQKAVLTLRDFEGYSYAEIGQITGLNESQVKVYIYRARLFLKQYIGSLEVVV